MYKEDRNILGISVALLTALAWAGSSTILKFLSAKIDTLPLNAIRLWVGSLILLSFVFLSGRGDDFVHTPELSLVCVIASGIVAIAIGDTVYIKSLSFLDVSRAFPIGQCTFPILTMFIAILLLGEAFTWLTGIGAGLVVLGIYFVAAAGRRSQTSQATKGMSWKGVILALTAAVAWTIGATILKIGIIDMDPFVAAAIRIPASTIVLTCFILGQKKAVVLQVNKYGFRNIVLAVAAGVLTYGVAAVGYVMAMQLIGAGKTVLLTAIAPLFILPFSIFILKERPTRYSIAGIFICVSGVYLVSI